MNVFCPGIKSVVCWSVSRGVRGGVARLRHQEEPTEMLMSADSLDSTFFEGEFSAPVNLAPWLVRVQQAGAPGEINIVLLCQGRPTLRVEVTVLPLSCADWARSADCYVDAAVPRPRKTRSS
ncbi:hypothetical protein ElyMa_002010300 [Elysia marginata]|uniref:Uncharacterized protein n=1 Tax=Elysia marginata TaxID=1093978 RepID=A0AAV4F3T3_9GAST|nr:hypothetical protein ElyMa_002010300 [Elysia marginata]